MSPSFIISKDWKRLVVLSALTSIVTTSTPVRVIAAEVMVPELPAIQAEKISTPSKAFGFKVPQTKTAKVVVKSVTKEAPKAAISETVFNGDVVREQVTGYKVVRTYRNVPSTAYTSRPQETDDTPFIAADGTHVYDGMVAANFLKFGTKIRIPEMFGDKVFEVHDRMNKRYNVKVDVWMAELKPALKYGLRHVTIEILQEADTTEQS